MSNLREALRARRGQPRETVTVDLPKLGVPVTLRALTYGDVKDIAGEVGKYLEVLLPRMMVDAEGNRLFQDDEALELDELTTEEFGILMTAAAKLNGVTKEAVDETIKNSKASLSLVSRTD